LQELAAKNRWRVLSVQQLTSIANDSAINVTRQLRNIKGSGEMGYSLMPHLVVLIISKGARVVALNCLVGLRVFEQANAMGMMASGWAWVVTDGITGFVRPFV
jgi:hypothetical protein